MANEKRSYSSPRRAAQARRTRERIVEAARRLWAERGFAAATMEAIAAEAGVAVQTVYGAFGSKGGILTALLVQLDLQAGGLTLTGEVQAAGTPEEQVRLVVAFNRRLFEESADVLTIALGSTAADADVATWIAEGDRRRREGLAHLAAGWHAAGALRPEVDAAEAGDILYTLTSSQVYVLLVTTTGWEPSRYERWLNQTLATLLLVMRGLTDRTPGEAGGSVGPSTG